MTKPQKVQILTFLATLLVIGLVLAFLDGMSDRRAKIFMASQKVGFDLVRPAILLSLFQPWLLGYGAWASMMTTMSLST